MADDPEIEKYDDIVKYWLNQITNAQKDARKYYDSGKKVLDRYKNEGTDIPANAPIDNRMNVLWSNVQTIMPALYAKSPTPDVARRHRDKDPVGRWGAVVLERALEYQLDAYDVDYDIRAAVLDYLLPGRGQVWVSYEPTFQGDDKSAGIQWERTKVKHVNWKDYLTSPARTWGEVWWQAQCAYLSKEEAKRQLDPSIIDELKFTTKKEEDRVATDDTGDKVGKAAIWEIWSKPDNKVFFVSKDCPKLVKPAEAPFLSFEAFFPCPRPIVTTVTTESVLPVPDFYQYKNQADEIDLLTHRINLLCKALRVIGIYDSSQEILKDLLSNTIENQMVPCDNFAALGGGKGLEGAIGLFPIDVIVKVLNECYAAREQAKQAMYEITGISDIVRGASEASETATAQQIKAQWGGLRIRDRQKEVQRFVRDIMRLQSEIIAERFQLETIKTMSNAPILMQKDKQALQMRKQAQAMAQQNPQMAQQVAQANPQLAQQLAQPLSMDEEQQLREPAWEEVYQLLKDEKLRCYRIDIETDSTIQADEQQEKADRTEFLTAMTGFITQLGPIAMQAPKFAPLFGEMLLFGARGFRTATTLETAIEEAVDALSQQAMMPAPQQPPPDPKVELDKQRLEHEKQMGAADLQLRQQEMQGKLALSQQEMQQKAVLAQQDQAHSHQLSRDEFAHKQETEKVKGETERAAASAPQLPPQGMAQLIQVVQQALTQMAESHQENEVQLAKQMQESLDNIAAMASAPKKVTIQRDASGKITGGVAKPQMTMQ